MTVRKKPNQALKQAYRRYPSLFPFGLDDIEHLTADEEATAPFETRLKSAWAYIVTVVIQAWKGYKEREKACLGLEDAMQDVVVALIEKDGSFDPTRGRYTTFAKMVALQAVAARRRHARAVSAPTGPVGRIKKYKVRDRDGTLSDHGRQTLRRLQVVLDDQDSITRPSSLYTDPDTVPDEVGHREEAEIAAREVVDSLQCIDPIGASVLAMRWGLFQADGDQTAVQIARQIPGHGPRKIEEIEERATHALRDHIRARRQQHESGSHQDAGEAGGGSPSVRELPATANRAEAGHIHQSEDRVSGHANPEPGDRPHHDRGSENR